MVSLVSERRAAVWVPVLVFRLLIGVCPAVMGSGCVWAEDLRGWRPLLSSQSVLQQEAERVVLQGSEWTWLVSPERRTDVSFEATVQVDSAATQFDFFGSGWSAWPDPQFGDRGLRRGCCCAERRMLPVVIECSCRRSIRSVHWCGIRTADMCVRYRVLYRCSVRCDCRWWSRDGCCGCWWMAWRC